MHIQIVEGAAQALDTELLVVNVFEGVKEPGGATGAVDKAMGGRIRDLIAAGDVKGKLGEVTVLYREGDLAARRLLIVGLGKQEDFGFEAIRHAGGAAAKKARDLGVTHFATIAHGTGAGDIAPDDAGQALVEGTILALYDFRQHKTKDEGPTIIEEMDIVEYDSSKIQDLTAGATAGKIVAESACLARDLVNEPANYATPSIIAGRAQAIADELEISCHILEREDIADLGMGAFLAVTQGSDQPPKLVVLEYEPGPDLPTLVLVGKGITFDSGGISLKPSENMHKMKDDMAGGAAVLGALRAAALLGFPLHIVGLIPLTENLPGGKAYKPGDVLTSMSGKTIEVQNTDAEGRLILADGLSYAARYKPQAVVDIATLTGACVVALGNITTGLFATDDGLAHRLIEAGEVTGERVWRMPLFKEYAEQLKSEVADISNTGGRPAGAITAGYFLSQFAEEYPWAHLDIAGTSWTDKPPKPYLTTGATGIGVRLLVELIRGWQEG